MDKRACELKEYVMFSMFSSFQFIVNMQFKCTYFGFESNYMVIGIGGHKSVDNEANFFINSLIR